MGHVNRVQRLGKTICQCVRASITPSLLIALRGVPLHSWMIVYKRAPPESHPAEDTDRLLNAGFCRLINGWMHFDIQKNWRAVKLHCFAPKVLQGPSVQQSPLCTVCPLSNCFLKEVIWLSNCLYRWHWCSDCTITFSQQGIWIWGRGTFIHSRLAIDVTCLWSGSIMPLWKSSVMLVVNLKSVIRKGVLKHPVLMSSLVWRKTPFCIINFVLLPDGAYWCCFPTCWTGSIVCDWVFRPNLAIFSLLILKIKLSEACLAGVAGVF